MPDEMSETVRRGEGEIIDPNTPIHRYSKHCKRKRITFTNHGTGIDVH